MISKKKSKINFELDKLLTEGLKFKSTLQKRSNTIGWIRALTFATGLTVFLLLYFFSYKTASIFVLILFSGIFIWVSNIQNRILFSIEKTKIWINLKKINIAKSILDWDNIPQAGLKFSEVKEPQEIDLDITGNRSLHQLIDFSKSRKGSELLRQLLLSSPANSKEILDRQLIVKELLASYHFREKFLLTSFLSSKSEIDSNQLLEWLGKTDRFVTLRKKLILLSVIGIINLSFVALAILDIVPKIFLITLFTYMALYLLNFKWIKPLTFEAETLNDHLKKVIGILLFIEKYRFYNKPKLAELCSAIQKGSQSPSSELKKVNLILTSLTFAKNPFIWGMLMFILPIDYLLAYKLEKYKKEIKEVLPKWLDSWHELESYVSISNFAYLNPDYCFPKIMGEDETLSGLSTKQIGHPLIKHEKKIQNDYKIENRGSISIITGSNMSGKSTFLRTVGINICLANAGSPVDAAEFNISMFRLFTCIRISDSVIDGISYFYAEVKRLKQLLVNAESSNELPVLFLIDEIFKGTNNKERLQGSRALLKVLINKNCLGLISTHDLDLVKLADESTIITNYHFREEVIGKAMQFDFKLRTGPCPTTNALKIMELNGLPI